MTQEPNENAAVAASATRPISVQLIEPWPGDRMRDEELDSYVTDPLIERHARQRSDKQTSRVLSILDELLTERTAR